MISSGYLRGTSKGAQAHLHPICCGPVLLPCLLPSTRLGGLLPAYVARGEMHFCQRSWKQGLQGSIELSAKSAPAASPRSWAPELVQGQDRRAWRGWGSRQDSSSASSGWLNLPPSFIFWLWFHILLSPAQEEGGGPAPHALSSPSHTLPPHSPWGGCSSQIALGQINSENWPSGNLTMHINIYANNRTVCCQICQPVNWVDSPRGHTVAKADMRRAEGTCSWGKGAGEREQDLLFQWKLGTGLAELLLMRRHPLWFCDTSGWDGRALNWGQNS